MEGKIGSERPRRMFSDQIEKVLKIDVECIEKNKMARIKKWTNISKAREAFPCQVVSNIVCTYPNVNAKFLHKIYVSMYLQSYGKFYFLVETYS